MDLDIGDVVKFRIDGKIRSGWVRDLRYEDEVDVHCYCIPGQDHTWVKREDIVAKENWKTNSQEFTQMHPRRIAYLRGEVKRARLLAAGKA